MSVLVRCTPHAEQTISRWLERVGEHSRLLHNQSFRNLALVYVQLDELYARVRQVGAMWLWLAIDPVSKILPALHLGKRTNDDAMAHDLQGRLEAGCVPAFTTDGLRGYFYALTAHPSIALRMYFGRWFRPPRARKDHWRVSDKLLHGQLVKLSLRSSARELDGARARKESAVAFSRDGGGLDPQALDSA